MWSVQKFLKCLTVPTVGNENVRTFTFVIFDQRNVYMLKKIVWDNEECILGEKSQDYVSKILKWFINLHGSAFMQQNFQAYQYWLWNTQESLILHTNSW